MIKAAIILANNTQPCTTYRRPKPFSRESAAKVVKVIDEDEDDDVTHTRFFGENIKRVVDAFKKPHGRV